MAGWSVQLPLISIAVALPKSPGVAYCCPPVWAVTTAVTGASFFRPLIISSTHRLVARTHTIHNIPWISRGRRIFSWRVVLGGRWQCGNQRWWCCCWCNGRGGFSKSGGDLERGRGDAATGGGDLARGGSDLLATAGRRWWFYLRQRAGGDLLATGGDDMERGGGGGWRGMQTTLHKPQPRGQHM